MQISVLLAAIAAFIATHASAQDDLEELWEDTWSDRPGEREEFRRSKLPSKLTWQDCGEIPKGMEMAAVKCAWLKVPVTEDDKKNDVPSYDEMVIPIIKAKTPGVPKRKVFYSPGGLGADWVNDQFLYHTDYKRLSKTLGKGTEIIVVGNRYTNWTTCLPENEPLRLDLTPGKKMFADSDVDKTLKKMWKNGEDYRYGCGNFRRKQYGVPYLGTKWAAKDLDRVRKKLGLAKISFFGESIGGTILGIEYARMFPDRVERMALDGVAPYSWYSQEHDPEEIAVAAGYWDKLWIACHKAGPRGYCGFYHDDIEEIRKAFFSIGPRLQRERYLLDIHGHPNENHFAPVSVVFDEQMWLKYVLQSLNDKSARKSVMNIASAISKNEPRALASDPGRNEPKWNPKETAYFLASVDRGGLQETPTAEEIRQRFFPKDMDILELGTDWPTLLTAAAMNLTSVDPPSKYPANVTTPPILFIGNTGDTRTPLCNARNWQEKAFPNGRLLTIDGIGHGLKAADIDSKCAEKYLSKYFTTGELPPKGTICEGLQFPEF
ncbi:Tripeptidyl aminopeptidase [Pseudocercospora fuligena]|uniref:Tripeptidyl aminopeptidase n=1 Tax=Pseudocercospora fuligena TaxID=685502 RepID=A0A8H6VHX3_9PEZI|nr:Tripeptidyl aminopeptidase [Pseudocercospora fuligena]